MKGANPGNCRRLREIRAAHSYLRGLFAGRSSFDGDQLEQALEFAGTQKNVTAEVPAQVIRRLLNWYEDGNPGVMCRVLDAGAVTGGFLWLQASFDRLIEGLKNGCPAVLFVTGIRETVRPEGRRWTRAAEKERTEYLRLLEDRIERWSSRTKTPVTLFVS